MMVWFFLAFFINVIKHIEALQITSISAGSSTLCALFDNSKVKCIGNGRFLGNSLIQILGDSQNELGDNLPFINFGTNAKVTKLVSGGGTTCVLLDTNNMKCLGGNEKGQTGNGISNTIVGQESGHIGDNLPTVNLGSGLEVIDFVLGGSSTCIIVTGNKVKCVGGSTSGQLGYESMADIGKSASEMGNNLPFVNLGTNVLVDSIYSSPSSEFTCAILSAPTASNQNVKCWGMNSGGQLGYGDTNNRGDESNEMGDKLPLLDFGVEDRVIKISTGWYHVCVKLITNEIRCWGSNDQGRLGVGNSSITQISSAISSLSPAIDSGKTISLISPGDSHTCIVYTDGLTLKCIGENSSGQLGQGNKVSSTTSTSLANIPAIDLGMNNIKITTISNGGSFTCAFFETGVVKCFGYNEFAQLGTGSTSNVGDDQYEMGVNLTAANLFVQTSMPTKVPTANPFASSSNLPSNAPTSKPSASPILSTKIPTAKPSNSTNSTTFTSFATSTTAMKAASFLSFVFGSILSFLLF